MRKEELTVYCDFCGKEITQSYDKSTPYVMFSGRIHNIDIDLCDNCMEELWEYVKAKKKAVEE